MVDPNKQQLNRQMTRNLIKFSNYSVCVTLPKNALEKLGWKSGQRVYMTADIERGTLTISKQLRTAETEENQVNIAQNNPDKLRW